MNGDDEPYNEPIPLCFSQQTERSPKGVEQQVLAISNVSAGDELAAAIDAADWLMCRARSIQNLCKQIGVAWIEHNGDLVIGPIRYHVGYSTTTRCTDAKRCGVTLLNMLGGDVDGLLNALVAQPFKPAHVRSILDQTTYRSLFATQSVGRLINGIPERNLTRTDTRFAVPRARS